MNIETITMFTSNLLVRFRQFWD